jgi:YD repeat-containing protein
LLLLQEGYDVAGCVTKVIYPDGTTEISTYNRLDLSSFQDRQGRLTTKTYADTSTVTYAYETTTSRLKSVTDALGQVKTYAYAKDDRLAGIANVESRMTKGCRLRAPAVAAQFCRSLPRPALHSPTHDKSIDTRP